jgi:ATP-dependent metalloprotease
MVKDWGMSEKIGLRTMTESSKPFQGDSLGPSTNELVDNEIRRILSESYDRAKHILKAHAKEHKALAEALMKYETLDAGRHQSHNDRERAPRREIVDDL